MYKKRKKRVKVYFKYSLTVQSIISNAATRGEGEGMGRDTSDPKNLQGRRKIFRPQTEI